MQLVSIRKLVIVKGKCQLQQKISRKALKASGKDGECLRCYTRQDRM